MEEIKSSKQEEIKNALSHGMGFLLTIVAAPLAIAKAVQTNQANLIFGVTFYCFSLLCMFAFSTVYHAFQDIETKATIRKFDHIAIFVLIGGSYIPFVILYTPVNTAFWFFTSQWTLIALGIIKKFFLTGKFRLLSSIIYIFIGCMVFFLGADFWRQIPSNAINYLVAGGLLYLVGVIFYQNTKIKNNHFIWHLFVLFAAFSHFWAVYLVL